MVIPILQMKKLLAREVALWTEGHMVHYGCNGHTHHHDAMLNQLSTDSVNHANC